MEYDLNDGNGVIIEEKTIYDYIRTLMFSGGGEENDPYLIESIVQFNLISMNPGSHYRLETDLDFQDKVFQPIDYFYGTFDGNGYKISNIYYEEEFQTISGAVGIFRHLDIVGTKYAEIKNLVLENIYFKISINHPLQNHGHFGIVAGYSYGIFSNITGSGTLEISAKTYSYGSIAGYSNGIIENCEVELTYINSYEGINGHVERQN